MPAVVCASLLSVAAYLIGGIPFSLLLVRWRTGIDLRKFGSGNIGASNARRAAGTAVGLAALACDALKGALPTGLAVELAAQSTGALPRGCATLVAVAAVVGHMFPVYLRFRPSGKGVATALGCFLILAPSAVAVALLVFIGVVAIFRRMSLGSLVACTVLPFAVWLTTHDLILLAAGIFIAALIVTRHKDNIRRLRRGVEPKV
jgi:glycerol-3-phosphate acyltransferase PlsY